MGHSTGEPFEMGKLIRNLSCIFFLYSFSSFASQITVLYYLNFFWLKYFTFISAELFCTTIRQAQFHEQGRIPGNEGAVTQHMIGEWLYLPVVIPPISAGMQSHQDHVIWGSEKTSEKKQRLTTMAGVPTNLYRPACGGSLEAESHLICCGGTTDTPLQGA